MHPLPRHIITEKLVGETPLVALERARIEHHIPATVPLAYAGRLDPMASGMLLILVGDECKRQSEYHAFDKEYEVELLLGIGSDTGDVLGLTKLASSIPGVDEARCREALARFKGPITLPYPHFSSKTVHGKPLHVWTLEGRLGEIEIPVKHSTIHRISFGTVRTITKQELITSVRTKIDSIPPVTDPRKALGEDFRREKVHAAWDAVLTSPNEVFQIISFTCVASSGTYMRTLCEKVAESLGTNGLAYSIHRTKIGRYIPLFGPFSWWRTQFRPIDSR